MINPELETHLEISPESTKQTPAFLARWEVPSELSYLQGHFPGMPMVPGVAVIDVTLEAIRRISGQARLAQLKSAKFTQPILPGQKIEIRLEPGGKEETWKAEWKVGSTLLAELDLRLRSVDG